MKHKRLFSFLWFVVFINVGQASLFLERIPFLDSFYSYLRTALFPVMISLFIFYRIKWSALNTILLFYLLVVIGSSFFNGVAIPIPLLSISMTTISLLCFMQIGEKFDYVKTIRILRDVYSFYVILNFFLVLFMPDGIWIVTFNEYDEAARYLLGGNYNQMGVSLLLACTTSILYYRQSGIGGYFSCLIFIVSLITLLIVGSKTSLLGLLLLLPFILIDDLKRKYRLLLLFIGFYFVFQIFAVFLLTDFSRISYVKYFVEEVLQKDLTFSSRSLIWFNSTLLFLSSPFIGFGYQDNDWLEYNINSISTHNFIYSLLIKGGLALLIVFVFLMITMMYKERKYRTSSSLIALSALWILLFMMIMEVYSMIHVIVLIGIVFLSFRTSKIS